VLSLGALVVILLLAIACGDARGPSSPGQGTVPPVAASTDTDAAAESGKDTLTEDPPSTQRGFESSIKFQRITREDGLSQGTISCVVQDSLGFMWFCTADGLNRYDGYDFTVYRHDPDDPESMGPGEIWAVYEDQEGMLWIWKYMGSLDRYDRNTDRFTRYDLFDAPDPESATSDFLWALYEDSGGTMWAGTYRSGLQWYDRAEDRFVQYRHDPDDPHSLSNDRVYAIFEDGDGVLWVGTKEGLNRLDRETGRFTRYRHDPDDPQSLGSDIVQLIFEDATGRFWVVTLGVGLEQFDRQTGKVVARYQHDPDDPTTIDATNRITEVYEDRTGSIWLVHFDRRLDRFDPETGTFTRYRHDPDDPDSLSDGAVSFVAEDRAGNLWVGTTGGLDRYDRATDGFAHYRHDRTDPQSLSSNALLTFYEDQAGVLWFGTSGSGLNLHDPRRTKFAHYYLQAASADPEDNNVVNAIFEDSAGFNWTGTDAGLNRFDPITGQLTHFRHDPLDPDSLSPGWVSAIYEDQDGRFWIGSQSGLDELDRATGRFIHYDDASSDDFTLAIGAVMSIFQDRAGVLWLARHRRGLCKLDPDVGKCTLYAYNPDDSLNPQDMMRQVYEDRDGTLWVGSEGGLLKFDRQTETFTPYEHDPSDPQSLSHNDVRSIYEDRSRRLWVATGGGGLNRLDRTDGTFERYTDKRGLPSNIVQGILEDAQGNLWLSTSNGLSRFDPREDTFRNYDTGDGLQGGEFLYPAYHQNAAGKMYFGGVNGFNAFHPEEIRDHPYVPPVALTSLSQGGVEVEAGEAVESVTEVTFSWPNNFFEFEFAALSYSQPEKNQYAYMLEGFRDETWNYIGTKRFGRYTNLPGGTYTLRLKGSNSDSVWNEEGTSLSIKVVPPFWETWWFRGLAIAGLALLGFAVYWQRVRGIRSRSQELERQVTNRTRELAALNAIAAVVSRSLDTQQILTDALDKTLEVTGLEAGGIYLLQENASCGEGGGILKVVAHKGLSAELVEGTDNLVVGEGFSGQVVQTGQPLVVGDLTTDPRLTRPVVRESGFRFVAIAPLVSRAAVCGTLFVMTRGETKFTQQDVELLSSIGVQIGVAIENAHLFAAEQRRAEQFRLINQVGRELTLILDVNEVLGQVTRMIQKAFGYYHVGIGLIEGDEVVYRVGAGELWDEPAFEFKPARLKVGAEGFSGWVAASGESLLIPDVSKDTRYVWLLHSRTRSELTVPVLVKGQVIGVLDVQSDRLNAFDDTDLAVLQSLAHQVGAAVENVQLYEQGQRAAVMEERSRLARDLHDAVTQTLFSASLIAEAVPASWELDQQEGRQLLRELQQLTRGALAEMRTLLLELRPAALIETGLSDLLHQLAEAAAGRAGVPVTVEVSGDCALPPDVHVVLYRISQEALNNVVKHARASQAELSLRCATAPTGTGSEVELHVRDDGRGFDPGGVAPDHLGLGIMRERAEAIGAHLRIETAIGQGTRVSLSWVEAGDTGGAAGR
jgi:signal transduction histidine kinase/ligand-binding sensor domain-containing protein